MTATGIGASVRRKEDQRFITGKGQYTDDINRPGQTYAYFVRSPHAHANIKRIDAAGRAGDRRACVAVCTGEDLAADKVGGLICGWMIHSKDGSPMKAGAASGARAGQGALCRRPRRRGHRRDAGAGQGRRRGGRRRLRGAAGRRRCRRRRRTPASRRSTTRRPTTRVYRVAPRRQGRDRRRLRRAPSTSPSSTSSTTG